ncbi:FabD/lysophospholipase-like protein [Sistotremastrum suecicum HHB10207 ss-3]|uniref:FabD/lysophospholipase-like protein n=1 Tax=Sistotremastrum suecicum HHB10207 ss-3 TaxID=1314776 RepID=A0A166D2F6_9AGAM|nr:FabD/lysophospholipase-like protein [Sistotremastrum suecicum HHB10207 ss-3]
MTGSVHGVSPALRGCERRGPRCERGLAAIPSVLYGYSNVLSHILRSPCNNTQSSVCQMSSSSSNKGLRLLSLDSGGVRGLSMLIILQEIMYRIQVREGLDRMPLPCQYFDLIGGSGTGGLIALLLGRCGMSIEECIATYVGMAAAVFRKVKRGSNERFRATILETEWKKIMKRVLNDENATMIVRGQDLGRPYCNTFVCAMSRDNMNANIPRLFHTYPVPKNPSFDCKIWEAARATTADPEIFKPIRIGSLGSSPEFYIGPTMIGRSNPIHQVLEQSALLHPDRHVGCVVSIGAGKPATLALPQRSLSRRGPFLNHFLPDSIVNFMQSLAKDGDRDSEDVSKRFVNAADHYSRLTVQQGLQTVEMMQWEKTRSWA